METIEQAKQRNRRTDGLVIKNDKMENNKFKEFLVKVFKNCFRALKKGASFYVWHASREHLNFESSLLEAELPVKQQLIWRKHTLIMGRQDYQWIHEPCLYGWKEGEAHKWYSDRKQTTVLDFDRPMRSDLHPTMKPLDLIAYLLKNSSKEGDNVLDLFGGSGSTLIACEQTNRNCYMMELDPYYCQVIINRWEEYTGGKAEKLN